MVSEEMSPDKLADTELDIFRVIELEYISKDGASCWSESSFRLVRDSNGKPAGILGVGRDITERKKVEKKLREQTQAMEAAIDGIAILDSEQKYLYLNRAHAGVYGYSDVEELIGRSWRSLYDREELLRFDNEIMPQFIKTGSYRGTAVGIKKDGSRFDQDLSLTALDYGGFVCIVRDITERKLIEKTLRESEEKYRLLVNHSSDLIWDLTLDGIFTYVSPSWERVTGYIPEEIVGTAFQPLVHPDDLGACLNYLEEMSGSSVVLPGPEYRVRHADGTWHWHAATGSPVISSNGAFVSLVGVSRDITERKLADLQIRNLLKEKEVVLKEVHHRIKNNMNTIFGLLALEAESHDTPEVKNVLLDSAGRVQSMMVLYDRLYRSEIKSSVSAMDYFPSLIKEIVAIFPNAQDVSLTTELEDIELDADTLSQLGIIINELITNTMKYAFQGRSGGNIKIKASKEGRMVSIVYNDNGNGLPENVSCETSSGFGLQLVGMLVKQIRGCIRIERNGGTKFIIEFEG